MAIEDILSLLQKVRRTGDDSWIACCPHHNDRSPSMTLRAKDDGRILLHCFAGCPANDILASIGLTFDALYPARIPGDHRPIRRPFNAHDVVRALVHEVTVAKIIASRMQAGTIDNIDRQRLNQASQRIGAAHGLITAGKK